MTEGSVFISIMLSSGAEIRLDGEALVTANKLVQNWMKAEAAGEKHLCLQWPDGKQGLVILASAIHSIQFGSYTHEDENKGRAAQGASEGHV